MTTLRDDGYLETDDPVVAACFLGKTVRITTLGGWTESKMWRINRRYVDLVACENASYPIRIPASTVAEVECHNIGTEAHWLMLCHSVDPTGSQRTLIAWLRQHTQETTDGV